MHVPDEETPYEETPCSQTMCGDVAARVAADEAPMLDIIGDAAHFSAMPGERIADCAIALTLYNS